MATFKLIHHFLSLLLLALLLVTTRSSCSSSKSVKAIYWFDQPLLQPSSINTSLFTHVIYSFLSPNNATYELHVSNSTAKTLTEFTTTLRTKTPPVKTLFSIGGSDANATLLAFIASNTTARATFINSTIQVSRTFGFDGIDLDWEFPINSDQMNDLGQLLREWRTAITVESAATYRPPLLLTAAVYFAAEVFPLGTRYPVDSINESVDWVNVMSYNLNGPWRNVTGAPSALFDPTRKASAVFGLLSWIRGGLAPAKLVMGIPLYGMTWQLKDPNVNDIGSDAVGSGPGLNGAMAFFQIVDFNSRMGAKVVYDVETASVYSYSGSSWVGYDDPFTVKVKVGFAQALSLRGYFFWAAGFDTTDWKISTQASKSWILA